MPDYQIAISYRRLDTPGTAGRIFDKLSLYFDETEVFIDEQLEGGNDFPPILHQAFSTCSVVLVIIGRYWLFDQQGNKRLDEPADFVRKELENALERGSSVLVLPLTIDGAEMPRPDDLPESIRVLARLEAVRVQHKHFDADMMVVVSRIINWCSESEIRIKEKPRQIYEHELEGLVMVHTRDPSVKVFEDWVRESNQMIRILYTYTHTFKWFDKALVEAILAPKSKVQFQVLLLHPDSPIAPLRGRLINAGVDMSAQLSIAISQLREFYAMLMTRAKERGIPDTELQDRISVRFYDELPLIVVFMSDEKALIAFYKYGEEAHNGPHFQINMNSMIGSFVDHQFNYLWSRAGYCLNLESQEIVRCNP